MPIKLPTRKNQALPQISYQCLPGGPKSATYDPTGYTYPTENDHTFTDGLQPSILAITGDTQVGGYGYDNNSSDAEGNRGRYAQPHKVTEKSFFTEITSKESYATYTRNLENEYNNAQTFLRVDLTEGGNTFRHNAVIVRGSIQCVNQAYRDGNSDSQYPASHESDLSVGKPPYTYDPRYGSVKGDRKHPVKNPKVIYGLVDFEYMFLCHPLASNEGSNQTPYESGTGRLSTLHTGYFHIKNRSWGGGGIFSISDYVDAGGYAYQGLNILNPLSLRPQHNFVSFGLQSETKADPADINVTKTVHRQVGSDLSNSEAITPATSYLSNDEDAKWDLNHVNFRFSPPLIDEDACNFGYPPKFVVKGTYLLI